MSATNIMPSESTPELSWYYARDRRKVGPVSFADLKILVQKGEIGPHDMVLEYGLTTWKEAGRLTGLILFPPQFYADLNCVVQSLPPQDPRECLPVLEATFKQRVERVHQRRRVFSLDLARVYEILDPDPMRILEPLEECFRKWRQRAVLELRDRVNTLPEDDPLRSGISLFGTMDLGRLERAHTNVLAWLLDPSEEHGFGQALVRALVEHMEGNDCGDLQVSSAIAEKLLPDNKRLDVFIEGRIADDAGEFAPWYMVIEAKVDAPEGGSLVSYDQWIDANLTGEVTRVFLTPKGREAETVNWKSLSFLELACVFRECVAHLKDRPPPGYHFLRFYLTGLLKDVCGWQLPLRDPEEASDPYGCLSYIAAVESAAPAEE